MNEITLDAECAVKYIKKALEKFGRYNYYDKGAHEVMFLHEWGELIERSTPADVAKFLNDLNKHPYEHTGPFITGLFYEVLEYDNDHWWDELDQYELPRAFR